MIVAVTLVALFLAEKRGLMDSAQVAESASPPWSAFPARGETPSWTARASPAPASPAASSGRRTPPLFLGRGLEPRRAPPRGGAQAQGGELPPRLRGVPVGRDEARPHRPHRPGLPRGGGRPQRPRARQDRVRHIAEIKARGACVISVATEGDAEVGSLSDHVMWLPVVPDWCTPIVVAVYLQLMARDVALARGVWTSTVPATWPSRSPRSRAAAWQWQA